MHGLGWFVQCLIPTYYRVYWLFSFFPSQQWSPHVCCTCTSIRVRSESMLYVVLLIPSLWKDSLTAEFQSFSRRISILFEQFITLWKKTFFSIVYFWYNVLCCPMRCPTNAFVHVNLLCSVNNSLMSLQGKILLLLKCNLVLKCNFRVKFWKYSILGLNSGNILGISIWKKFRSYSLVLDCFLQHLHVKKWSHPIHVFCIVFLDDLFSLVMLYFDKLLPSYPQDPNWSDSFFSYFYWLYHKSGLQFSYLRIVKPSSSLSCNVV